MSVSRDYHNRVSNERGYHIRYHCSGTSLLGKCKGCSIASHIIDDAAWAKVLEVVRDPSKLAQKILARKTKDPTEENRKNINKKLAGIKRQKGNYQTQLAELMKERTLDPDTREFLTRELHRLNDDEHQWKIQLAKVGEVHDKWEKVHNKLDELLSECENPPDIVTLIASITS